jgi:hypothetical protein
MIGYNGEKISSSGKGSKPRHRNNKSYKENYDKIDWGRSHKPKGKVTTAADERLFDHCRCVKITSSGKQSKPRQAQ